MKSPEKQTPKPAKVEKNKTSADYFVPEFKARL